MKKIAAVMLAVLMCAGCRDEATSVRREQTEPSAKRESDERVIAIECEMTDMKIPCALVWLCVAWAVVTNAFMWKDFPHELKEAYLEVRKQMEAK